MKIIRIPHLYKNSGRKTIGQIERARKCAVLEPLKFQKKDIISNFPVEVYYNKTEDYGYCTSCQKEIPIKGLAVKHDSKIKCPCCKKEAKAINIRLFKSGRSFIYRVYAEFWRAGKNGTISVPIVETRRFIQISDGKIEMEDSELPKTVLVIDGSNRYRFMWTPYGLILNDKTDFIPRGMWGIPILEVIKDYALPVRESQVKGTVYEYFLKALKKNGFQYSAYHLAHMTSVIEKLLSAGYTGIARELFNKYVHSYRRSTLDSLEDRPKIHQMLGIPKSVLDKWTDEQKAGLEFDILEKKAFIKKLGLPIDCLKLSMYTLKDLQRRIASRNLDPIKVISKYQALTPDYLDYIDALRNVGKYPDEPQYLYPSLERFQALHDEMIALAKAKAEEETKKRAELARLEELKRAKQIEEYARELRVFEYSDEKYLIRPLLSAEDMIHESEVMHHCIRTYQERYAGRTTSLFTIRRINKPNVPICSVEIKHNSQGWFVVQSRAKFNADPDAELQAFVQAWMQTVSEYCKTHKRATKKLYRAVA